MLTYHLYSKHTAFSTCIVENCTHHLEIKRLFTLVALFDKIDIVILYFILTYGNIFYPGLYTVF